MQASGSALGTETASVLASRSSTESYKMHRHQNTGQRIQTSVPCEMARDTGIGIGIGIGIKHWKLVCISMGKHNKECKSVTWTLVNANQPPNRCSRCGRCCVKPNAERLYSDMYWATPDAASATSARPVTLPNSMPTHFCSLHSTMNYCRSKVFYVSYI